MRLCEKTGRPLMFATCKWPRAKHPNSKILTAYFGSCNPAAFPSREASISTLVELVQCDARHYWLLGTVRGLGAAAAHPAQLGFCSGLGRGLTDRTEGLSACSQTWGLADDSCARQLLARAHLMTCTRLCNAAGPHRASSHDEPAADQQKHVGAPRSGCQGQGPDFLV